MNKLQSVRLLLLVIAAVLLAANPSLGEIRIPGFFSDHMVFQQNKPIRVWGWAAAGESITVTLGNQTVQTTADGFGKWNVELPAINGGSDAYTLLIAGNTNQIQLKDVLIGEVWLCSGQSNMQHTVNESLNAREEIAAANYPMIRHLHIVRKPSILPLDDLTAEWQVCSPGTVAGFTACGFFMARELHKELKVPVGLIHASWGGTRIEPWTSPAGFQKVPALQSINQSVLEHTPGTEVNRKLIADHIANTERWLAEAKTAFNNRESTKPSPEYPKSAIPFSSHQDPTMLYNGMIHALVRYPIRGVIWYQGEANHAEGALYVEKKKALIAGWRESWGQGDFPFYYVQIAPYKYGNENGGILPEFWEAQSAVQQIPNTGMVVTNDVATINNIHPPNKQSVGQRLALLALKNDYGRDIVANSPVMDSMQVLDGAILIQFKHGGGGLKTRDDKTASHFELIGPDSGGYQPSTATIEGDSVRLTSPQVKSPTAFRFAWNKTAEPNLMGGTGLPVAAFRGGKVPDFLNTVPFAKDYRLVFDLNLEKLGQKIVYDQDQSRQAPRFNRIAYLLELKKGDGTDQAVFVAMDAFTDDAKKIGIPTLESGASFQQKVTNMQVFSDVAGVVTGDEIQTGNIEFWPDNYAPKNQSRIQDASNEKYDFGDRRVEPLNGYGSMQVHNFGEKQTVFSINHWKANPDIGIGNNPGTQPDWTFSENASSYIEKRLRVFVK